MCSYWRLFVRSHGAKLLDKSFGKSDCFFCLNFMTLLCQMKLFFRVHSLHCYLQHCLNEKNQSYMQSISKINQISCCMEQAPFTYFPEIGMGIWDWGGFPLLAHCVFPALQHQHNSSFLETASSSGHKKVGPTYENTNFL